MKLPVTMHFILALLCAQSMFLATHAAIHHYDNVILPRNALMFRRSGMFSAADSPSGAGGEDARITLDFSLERVESTPSKGKPYMTQIAFMDAEVWERDFGTLGPAGRVYCCTSELVKAGKCTTPSTLILSEDASKGTQIYNAVFESATEPVRVRHTFAVPTTGLKYLVFSTCNSDVGPVRFNGESEWREPYGLLPGESYGFLPFTYRLAVCYVVASALWGLLAALRWKSIMVLQITATIALTVGMLEMSLRYYDFALYNASGVRSTTVMIVSSLFHTMKQTVSRLLVLLVSLGFGVARPKTLSYETTRNIAGLLALFFFFSALQRLYEVSAHSSNVTLAQYVTMLPVAAVDVLIFIWTTQSLNEIINGLRGGRESDSQKLALYTRFRTVIFVLVASASAWALIYAWAVLSGRISREWSTRWMFDAFFDLLYFTTLMAIMVLWRPTSALETFTYERISAGPDAGSSSASTFEQVPAAGRRQAGKGLTREEEYGEDLEDDSFLRKSAQNGVELTSASDRT